MPTVACDCGETFEVEAKLTDQWLECPVCGKTFWGAARDGAGEPSTTDAENVITAATAREIPGEEDGDGIFDRNVFLLRKKVLAISGKYSVLDEQGRNLLFVRRPSHLLRGLLAIFVGINTFALGILLMALAVSMPAPEWITLTLFAILLPGSFILAVTAGIMVSAKRHIHFYRDETATEMLLTIRQEKKFAILKMPYLLEDSGGKMLARLEKNYAYDILRKRWNIYDPEGKLRWIAREDSIVRSIARRLLGPMSGALRANFIIVDAATGELLGKFNRELTIRDRYALDLRPDMALKLDRRIALAIGVLLDSGERR